MASYTGSTVADFPYRVGRMVYPNLAEATAAIRRAEELGFDTASLFIIDRATGKRKVV